MGDCAQGTRRSALHLPRAAGYIPPSYDGDPHASAPPIFADALHSVLATAPACTPPPRTAAFRPRRTSFGCHMRPWCGGRRRRWSTSMPPSWSPTATRCWKRVPAAVRDAGHARRAKGTGPALARLGRAGRCLGPGGDQQPRHRGCRPGEGLARRQARVRGRDRAQGRSARTSRCCASRRTGERFPALEFADSDALQVGDVVLAIGNPFGGRPDRHPRHRVGGGTHPGRHHRLSVLHPDRCRHQSRQLRRCAGRSWRPPGRHQHRDLLALRRLAGHRLRHPGQHGAGGRRVGGKRRQRWSSGRGSVRGCRR